MAYLVIGGIFMYTQRGARGAEIIPNYSFWKDLPFLVMVKPSFEVLFLDIRVFPDRMGSFSSSVRATREATIKDSNCSVCYSWKIVKLEK